MPIRVRPRVDLVKIWPRYKFVVPATRGVTSWRDAIYRPRRVEGPGAFFRWRCAGTHRVPLRAGASAPAGHVRRADGGVDVALAAPGDGGADRDDARRGALRRRRPGAAAAHRR